jgi:hypothetical protein
MLRVVESRGAWDTVQRIGMIDIMVVPEGPRPCQPGQFLGARRRKFRRDDVAAQFARQAALQSHQQGAVLGAVELWLICRLHLTI